MLSDYNVIKFEINNRKKNFHPGDCPGGAVVKNPPANSRDKGLSPSPGRSHMLRSN